MRRQDTSTVVTLLVFESRLKVSIDSSASPNFTRMRGAHVATARYHNGEWYQRRKTRETGERGVQIIVQA
jgi:hypothetical protein